MHVSSIDALVYASAMLQSKRNVAKHLPVQEQLFKVCESAG